MANGYTTIQDILKLPLSERQALYGTTDISYIEIDGEKFGGYKAFSSFWEKTYVKQPERSSNGMIENLDSYTTFTTFHLKIDFAMISIADYRRLYDLMLSKNEFRVTAYDTRSNSAITQNMYFAPDQMPKLYSIARKITGDSGVEEKFFEVIGVQDYTIELIGTNTPLVEDTINTVTYYLNPPNKLVSKTLKIDDVEIGDEYVIGNDVTINGVPVKQGFIYNSGDGKTYKFNHWNTRPDGSGNSYLQNVPIVIQEHQFVLSPTSGTRRLNLNAIWVETKK